MFPIIISGLVGEKREDSGRIEYDTLRSGSNHSIYSPDDSNERVPPPRPPPPKRLPQYQQTEQATADSGKDDLYSWMAKQTSSSTKMTSDEHNKTTAEKSERPISPSRPNIATFNDYPQESGRLLDAHLIFEPLLTCLGVMPTKRYDNKSESSSLENLGTNLSLVCLFDTLRIDIVVSEAGDKRPKAKINKKTNGKFSLNCSSETPAFLSEKIDIELEIVKVTEGLMDHQKQLYISRGKNFNKLKVVFF